ncbi:MAG: NAD(P)-binding domain-containing protein [Chlamydiota bacterium]
MTVLIVGAGPAGIVAAKTAIECGLKPTVLEKNDRIGGLWRSDTGYVWNSMRTNISYSSCMFSDAPWKNPSGNFPKQIEVCNYLKNYAQHNNILKHIRFNADVGKLFRFNKKWHTEWYENGAICQKEFDYGIVCSGIFSKPHIPTIPGLNTFAGRISHSKDYKDPETFKNKKVVVVGNAFSGTEIAAEVSTQAEQTVHCANRAMWILPRHLPVRGTQQPWDLIFYRRSIVEESKKYSFKEKNEKTYLRLQGITKQNQSVAELAVTSDPTDPSYVTISDTYINQVKDAKIKVKYSKIHKISERTLIFEDNTETSADELIFATGYEASLPFFGSDILEKLEFDSNNRFQPLLLDRCTFNPHLPNMAFVGMYRGPYFPIMELQARLACYVFSKKIEAVTQLQMEKGMELERRIRMQIPRPQFPHGNYVEFADMLAEAAGVLPDFKAIQVSDPKLYEKIWEGPLNASHYRLNGYASKPEMARNLINQLHTKSKS